MQIPSSVRRSNPGPAEKASRDDDRRVFRDHAGDGHCDPAASESANGTGVCCAEFQQPGSRTSEPSLLAHCERSASNRGEFRRFGGRSVARDSIDPGRAKCGEDCCNGSPTDWLPPMRIRSREIRSTKRCNPSPTCSKNGRFPFRWNTTGNSPSSPRWLAPTPNWRNKTARFAPWSGCYSRSC